MDDRRSEHWDGTYSAKRPEETSWFEVEPTTSLALIDGAVEPSSCIDVGAGRSTLVDALLIRGWSSVTVLDLSGAALDAVQQRLGDEDRVRFVVGDVLAAVPPDPVTCWHDRAVLHFLTDAEDRARYATIAAATVAPGGIAVIGSFAPDGPEACSGLPVHRVSADELATLFAPAFVLERAERVEHTTPWGAAQPFTWVVLRRV